MWQFYVAAVDAVSPLTLVCCGEWISPRCAWVGTTVLRVEL